MASKISGRSLALEIARTLGASEDLIAQINSSGCWKKIVERCLGVDEEMTIRVLNRMVIYNTDKDYRHYIRRSIVACKNLPASVLVLILSEQPDWTVFYLAIRHRNTPASALQREARGVDPDKQREANGELKKRGC